MMIDNGFNDSVSAYCDTCGRLLLINVYSGAPNGVEYGTIDPDLEPLLQPCVCGGFFRARAVPRCPSCHGPLDAGDAASYIEANASGAKGGWRWQRSWAGLYSIAVEIEPVHQEWPRMS
jgi:hypothetical protein